MSIRKIYTPAEYHHMVAALMKEKEWQQQVIDMARTLGYQVYHTFDSRRSEKGYPDLTLCKPGCENTPGRLIFAELKTERGRLRREQMVWLNTLATCPGIETYVWRPSNIDEIIAILEKTG